MRNARVSPNGAKIHSITQASVPGVPPQALCGQRPIAGVEDPDAVARWRWTEELLTCQTCLDLTGEQRGNFVWRQRSRENTDRLFHQLLG